MIIRGRFIGDAPYFALHLRATHFQGLVWMLADTGASRTLLLDRDAIYRANIKGLRCTIPLIPIKY